MLSKNVSNVDYEPECFVVRLVRQSLYLIIIYARFHNFFVFKYAWKENFVDQALQNSKVPSAKGRVPVRINVQ